MFRSFYSHSTHFLSLDRAVTICKRHANCSPRAALSAAAASPAAHPQNKFRLRRYVLSLFFSTLESNSNLSVNFYNCISTQFSQLRDLSCRDTRYSVLCWYGSMFLTISTYPELSVRVLSYGSMSCTISPWPELTVHVLFYQPMSCTINPCPTLSFHVLYYQSMS